MQLESQRLTIFPLDHRQLLLYLEAGGKLEYELGLADTERSIPAELVAALRETIVPAVAEVKNDVRFHTLWTMIDKDSHQLVGDLCFKGPPNERGEVEIGYGTYESFQGKGYMTEAIGMLTQWAFTQHGIDAVIAETDIGNVASHRVLEKNGFSRYKTVDTITAWWRLEKGLSQ